MAEAQLLAHVRPPDWVNPVPPSSYDVVVIGAGTAGLVTAAGIAGLGLGLRVALVEKHRMGGDCLNFGCVPSKTLIRSAKVAATVRQSLSFGVNVPVSTIDFPQVMARVGQIRAAISRHDAATRFRDLGVDVWFGTASFLDRHRVQVDGRVLSFQRSVIATGARARIPAIEGLSAVGFLTNETVFDLSVCPARLGVIGGGPIGCELAQAFQRLGVQVFLFHKHDRLLDREDEAVGQVLLDQFHREGIEVFLSSQISRIGRQGEQKIIYFAQQGQEQAIPVDEILVATGRQPNLEDLQLERAGVVFNARGILVNDFLQTTNPSIYACGDICMDWKFTHAADSAARLVIKNMLFCPWGLGRSRLSNLVMPWVTFTDPEVAHVGRREGKCITVQLSDIDRAITDGTTQGFVKIWHHPHTDRILGATIVAPHAGEMIGELTLAIGAKVGLNQLAEVIHPYPTLATGIKKAADLYRRTLLTPRNQSILRLLAGLNLG